MQAAKELLLGAVESTVGVICATARGSEMRRLPAGQDDERLKIVSSLDAKGWNTTP